MFIKIAEEHSQHGVILNLRLSEGRAVFGDQNELGCVGIHPGAARDSVLSDGAINGKGKEQACKNHRQHGDLLSPRAPVPITQKAAQSSPSSAYSTV